MKVLPGETAGLSIPELEARIAALHALPDDIDNRDDLIRSAEGDLAFQRQIAALRAGQTGQNGPAA